MPDGMEKDENGGEKNAERKQHKSRTCCGYSRSLNAFYGYYDRCDRDQYIYGKFSCQ